MPPSVTHEGLIALFRNRPALAPELMRDALHLEVPAYSEARIECAVLTDLSPAEVRADLVVLLVDGAPMLAIVVEVQLRKNERKRFTWPVYVAGLRARLSCPACVLVVTPSESVAEWARAQIDLGPGGSLTPLVVGPASVPVVDDVAAAKRDPELAVLSVMAHGREPRAEEIARAALLAADGLDRDRPLLYFDLVYHALSDAAKAALGDLMASGNYVFQSDFAKKYLALGREEGRTEALARAVIAVLEARGLSLSDDDRNRVSACTDMAQLDAWVRKAVTAATVDELFGG